MVLSDKRPSTEETMEYLRRLGVRTVQKTSMVNCATMRAQFRPDGSILTVRKSDNKMVI